MATMQTEDGVVEVYDDLISELENEVDNDGNVRVNLEELVVYVDEQCEQSLEEGRTEGRIPGMEQTETGDFISCLRLFADNFERENDRVRLLSYRELNDLKRRLIEEIDEMMER